MYGHYARCDGLYRFACTSSGSNDSCDHRLILMSHLGAAFTWCIGTQFLRGLLCLLLLDLIEYALCLISVLVLLEEADEQDMIIWQSFMCF